MHVGAAFVADEESFHLVQPAEGALDDPATVAQPGAVAVVAVGDQRRDATVAESIAESVRVVAAVAEHDLRAPPWPSGTAADRGHAIEQGQQLRDVVLVACRQRPRQRCPVPVGQEVMLGAWTAAIDRARARFGAPFFACTWLESTTARDHSSSPAARSLANNSA